MKSNSIYYLIFGLILLSKASFSQSPTCVPLNTMTGTPADCTWNLTCEIFSSIDSTFNGPPIYYGKLNKPIANYKDVMYADDKLGTDAGLTASELASKKDQCIFIDDCSTVDTSSLKYHVYYPLNHNYSQAPLPAVILFHAGGFSDCSSFDLSFIRMICREFAKRGFVAYTVEFRRGRVKDPDPNGFVSVQQQLGVYRASQDGRGALRSIIKAEQNSGANAPFHIDTNKIFIGGASAGAVVAINTAYYRNQNMVNKVFPSASGSQTIDQVLGPIDASFYKGNANNNYFSHIKGVLSLWGGISIPYSNRNDPQNFLDTTSSDYNPPLIAFHGFKDPVFPYTGNSRQTIRFSAPPTNGNFDYNKEQRCLIDGTGPYQLETNPVTPDLFSGSALNLYNALKVLPHNPKISEIYVDCQMGHGLDKDNDLLNPNRFQSDFGLGLPNNSDNVSIYLVQRAACFFQMLLNNYSGNSLSTTKFTETRNDRFNNCITPLDNYDNGHNQDCIQ